jgi:hypothetical protein
MKKMIIGAVLLAFAAAIAAPAVFAGDPEIKVHAETWARYEFLSNWLKLEDDQSGDFLVDDSIDFASYRTRVGVEAKVNDVVSAYIEIQNHGTWGDSLVPSNAQDPLVGPINLTGFAQNNDTQLYQAFMNLDHVGGSLLSLKIGRQEHTLGNELHMGDADFYSGQYFDGIRGTLDFESWVLDVFHYWIEERNVLPGSLVGNAPPPFNGNSNDRTFFGATAAFSVGDGHDLEPYVLQSKDNNWAGGAPGGGLFLPAHEVTTIGVLYERPEEFDSPFDWSLEVAVQTGEVPSFFCPGAPLGATRCDLSSSVVEAAFGYTFGDEDEARHRVGVGALLLGDGDDTTEVESFVELFPDTHRRAGMADVFSTISTMGGFFGDTFHNLSDIYLEWDWTNDTHTFGAAYHMFTCTEEANCFNFGGPDDDLGSEIDAWYNWTQSGNFDVHVGIAMWDPGDTFESVGFDPDGVMRAFGMARFRM